jgi:hypothetical protein
LSKRHYSKDRDLRYLNAGDMRTDLQRLKREMEMGTATVGESEAIDDAQDAILTMLGQRTLLQALTELESRESAKRTTSKVRLSVQNKR